MEHTEILTQYLHTVTHAGTQYKQQNTSQDNTYMTYTCAHTNTHDKDHSLAHPTRQSSASY